MFGSPDLNLIIFFVGLDEERRPQKKGGYTKLIIARIMDAAARTMKP